MKTIGIIPARYASTRFPGKLLKILGGKTILQRVFEQAQKASCLNEVVVATDDKRIFEHVSSFGGKVYMTSSEHRSGTDRCAEVARQISRPEDVIINIQGDEPFLSPAQIEQVAAPIIEHKSVQASTLAKRIASQEVLFDPNAVKVVFAADQSALYFSRSTIPFLRGLPREQWIKEGVFYKHIGLYAFRSAVIQAVTALPASPYEQMESLEQLRWLEAGYRIFVGITTEENIGIDTPEDLEKAMGMI
jgi:3-deoxy-manno-octulosonate cytidylyltransferase (CMP-KDO synthetase)